MKSEPGRGTVFDILLPKVTLEGVSEGESYTLPSVKNRRILIVDDEEALVNVVENVLCDFGYRVVGKTDSVEAMQLFRQIPEQFDLVIADCTMPRISGMELAEEMMTIRPDIPIILYTGFNESVNRETAVAMGIRDLLMKPISVSELTGMVDKLLSNH
ncbi:MAG: response regulator [Thermodesulfobacteriota bacterium]